MNYKIDHANTRQPDVLRVNQQATRVYWNQKKKKVTDADGNSYDIFEAKFIEVATTSTDKVAIARQQLLDEIAAYDVSSAVNEFTLNGTPMWIPRADREALMRRFEAEKAASRETTNINQAGQTYTLPIDTAIAMMNQLEVYAADSYDCTQAHLGAAAALTEFNDIVAYDYTTGYPSKLAF